MFEHFAIGPRKGFENYTAISLCVHAGVVCFVIGLAAVRARQPLQKEVVVSFLGPGKTAGAPPPPPPPPAGKKHTTPKRKLAKTEIPKPSMVAPKIDLPPPVSEPVVEDEGVEGGVEGGVAGGVVGGVVGGQLRSTGGGGEAQPPVDKPKPRNVPPFVIQRDLLQQTPIHLSEVFKNSHRAAGVMNGMYKVCVGTDGHVYEVEAVKSVPGADEDIIEGMKEGWLYKPQQVPVCFLYNVPIAISQ
jgi:protein TonB